MSIGSNTDGSRFKRNSMVGDDHPQRHRPRRHHRPGLRDRVADRRPCGAFDGERVMPVRIQRQRTKGWRMPPNTVSIARPGRLGNPFLCRRDIGDCEPEAGRCCLVMFEEWVRSGVEGRPCTTGSTWAAIDALAGYPRRTAYIDRLRQIRGKNVACYCALDRPCHGDIIIAIANGDAF
jgi:hypothetical protein